MKIEQFLEMIYFNAAHALSYSSVNKLYSEAKLKYPNVKKSDIMKWLSSKEVYALHKQIRKRFKQNKIRVYGKDDQWQADLVGMNRLTKSNKGFHYILTRIDILSKYAWANSSNLKLQT